MPPLDASIEKSKAEHAARVDRELRAHIEALPWTAQQKLVLTARILAAEGHFGGLAGQITARADRPGTFWTLALGIGFDEATPKDFVLVDDDLNVLAGRGMPNPATRFHLWIYRHRPDLQCILHTHPPAISALSMLDTPLVVAHMDATQFHDDCAYLDEWPGLPIGDDEGRIISAALGNKRSILLSNHGMITTGTTVEEAAYLAVYLERAADMQLRASAVGPLKHVRPERAKESHDFLLKPEIVGVTFAYFARRILRASPDCLA